MSYNTRSRSNYCTTHSRSTAHTGSSNVAPHKTFSEQICASLNDPSVINAFGKSISDRFIEALGAMQDRLRAYEDSIKAKNERIEQL